MKTRILLIASILLFSFSTNLFAKKVEYNQAKKVAINFYYQGANQYVEKTAYNDIEIKDVYIERSNNEVVYYVFNMKNKGFVIVSADDVFYPVLGYSYVNFYKTENIPYNIKSWMQSYVDQLFYAKKNKIKASQGIKKQWQHFLTNDINQLLPSNKNVKDVAPLLKSKWDQGKYYNQMCPKDDAGSGKRTYTGCIATAMAQIMYYYRYPLHGQGSKSYYQYPYGFISADFGNTTYQWNQMINSVHQEDTAVAILGFHCGVGVKMHYGTDGSGAYSKDVAPAIKTYFNYSSSAQFVKKINYSSTDWKNLLLGQLDDLQPIYYSGSGSEGGHAFVCDGYQIQTSITYFHFNFGWSGYSNGYYLLNNLNGFSSDQAAVINFVPNESQYPYYCTDNDTLISNIGTFEDGSSPLANYKNNTDCSWLIAPDDSVKNITLSFDRFDTESDNDIVTVYDGATNSDSILGIFSGSEIPGNITSTGDKMLVTFITNGSNTSLGWQASFSTHVPKWCNGFITLDNYTDTLNDGSGGKFNYHNNTNCGWVIEPPYASSVTLTFISFNIEKDNDVLKIYDKANNNLLAEYSGTDIPDPVTSPSGGMYLIFKTNYCVNAPGWEAYYTIPNVGINDNNKSFVNLNIYPNPVNNVLNIKFNIDKTQSLYVKIFSIAGKTVYSENINNFKGNYNKSIDVHNYSKGIYILSLTSDKETFNKKVVIE